MDSEFSSEKSVVFSSPPAPSEVVATQDGFDASGKPRVKIAFKNNWPTAILFEIQRSENSSSGFVPLSKDDFGSPYLDLTTTCGKTYYYKLAACNLSGNSCSPASAVSNGLAVVCQAPGKPATPTDLNAVVNGDFNAITVSWKNTVADASNTKVERKAGNETFLEIRSFTNGTTLSFDDNTGLVPGTTYTYKVKVVKSGVDSEFSSEKSVVFSTPPSPSDIVATQDGFDATGKPRVKVAFKSNWPAATIFEIQRSENSSSGFVKVEKNDFGSPYLDLTTTCGKTYFYKLIACNTGGNICSTTSAVSNALAVQCQAPNKPATPTDLNAVVASDYSKITISWKNTVTDASDTKVERKAGNGPFTEIKNFTNGTTVSFDDNASLVFGTVYTYKVKVIKSGAESDFSAEKAVTYSLPPAPSEIVATQDGFDASGKPRVKIAFKSNWPIATIFEIQRSENSSSGFVKVDKNDFGSPYLDLTTTCGKTYYYKLIACNNAGNICSIESAVSNGLAVQCQASSKPAAPTDLNAVVSSDYSKIAVSWKNTVTDATITKVERKAGSGAFTEIKTFNNGTTLSFDDNASLVFGTVYTYKVKVIKSGAESDFSAEKSVTYSQPPPPSELVATQDGFDASGKPRVRVAFKSNWPAATIFEIQRSENSSSGFVKVEKNDFGSPYLDLTTTCGKTYFYKLIACNTGGNICSTTSAVSNGLAVQCQTNPEEVSPKNLRKDNSNSNINQISIMWDNIPKDIENVEIWKKTGLNGPWEILDSLLTKPLLNNYQDRKVRTGNVYQYKVRSRLQDKTLSGFSNEIQIAAPVVNGLLTEAAMKIFPNPASDYLELENSQKEISSVQIVNIQGRIVFEDKKVEHRIALSSIPGGIYFLVLIYDDKKETFKFIKE